MIMPIPTEFAPAEREDSIVLLSFANEFRTNPLAAILDMVPIPLIIINEYRQALFCNNAFYELTKRATPQEILGLRPGEALGCIHSELTDGGCGTTRFCRYCGAAIAILKSLQGKNDTQECRVMRHSTENDEALDLHVFTSPFEYQGLKLNMFTAIDISHEKRRHNLERLFFHDILNLATGVKYATQVACHKAEDPKMLEQCDKISRSVMQIVDEIQAQKRLAQAEKGELRVSLKKVSSHEILNQAIENYSSHKLSSGKNIVLSEGSNDVEFSTDRVVLGRVLGNMLKNALEASDENFTITLGSNVEGDFVSLWVHNDFVMPERVKRQIFKRSFTTKGEGRGLGTYSIKLLAEQFLGGLVSFKSEKNVGTVFCVKFPLHELSR